MVGIERKRISDEDCRVVPAPARRGEQSGARRRTPVWAADDGDGSSDGGDYPNHFRVESLGVYSGSCPWLVVETKSALGLLSLKFNVERQSHLNVLDAVEPIC